MNDTSTEQASATAVVHAPAVLDDITEDLVAFRANVRDVMAKRGLNATQLCGLTGMKNSTLHDVLNTNTNLTFTTAKRIATALRIPLWKILKPKKSR